jgi:hypothetical protein
MVSPQMPGFNVRMSAGSFIILAALGCSILFLGMTQSTTSQAVMSLEAGLGPEVVATPL